MVVKWLVLLYVYWSLPSCIPQESGENRGPQDSWWYVQLQETSPEVSQATIETAQLETNQRSSSEIQPSILVYSYELPNDGSTKYEALPINVFTVPFEQNVNIMGTQNEASQKALPDNYRNISSQQKENNNNWIMPHQEEYVMQSQQSDGEEDRRSGSYKNESSLFNMELQSPDRRYEIYDNYSTADLDNNRGVPANETYSNESMSQVPRLRNPDRRYDTSGNKTESFDAGPHSQNELHPSAQEQGSSSNLSSTDYDSFYSQSPFSHSRPPPPYNERWRRPPPEYGWHRPPPRGDRWQYSRPSYPPPFRRWDNWGRDRRPPPPYYRGWDWPPPGRPHHGPPPPYGPPPHHRSPQRYDDRPPPYRGPPPDHRPPPNRPPPNHGPPDFYRSPPDHRPPPGHRPPPDHRPLYDRFDQGNGNYNATSFNQSLIEAIFGTNPEAKENAKELLKSVSGRPLSTDYGNNNINQKPTTAPSYLYQVVPVTPDE